MSTNTSFHCGKGKLQASSFVADLSAWLAIMEEGEVGLCSIFVPSVEDARTLRDAAVELVLKYEHELEQRWYAEQEAITVAEARAMREE